MGDLSDRMNDRMDANLAGSPSAAGIPRAPQPRVDAEPARVTARPLADWYEELGDVLWWVFDEDGNPTEAPWVGSPVCLGQTVELHAGQGPHKDTLLFRGHVGGWPGYHTHWTPLPPAPAVPKAARTEGAA
jgi:hypothetical protein